MRGNELYTQECDCGTLWTTDLEIYREVTTNKDSKLQIFEGQMCIEN